MDLRRQLQLGVAMDDERADLISRLLALLTAKFEDGAAEASKGQGRGKEPDVIAQIASQVQSMGEEIAIIAEAAMALAQHCD